MNTTAVLVWCSSFAVFFAVLTLLNYSSQIYYEITELAEYTAIEIKSFKANTDQSWSDLISIRMTAEGAPKKRSVVSQDVFADFRNMHKIRARQSRLTLPSRLPSWCQCEPVRLKCPLGPAGPPGRRGAPGLRGERGPPGRDNFKVYPAIVCTPRDTACVRCPSGPPGFRGTTGKEGAKGPPGLPGPPGQTTRSGPRGPPGPEGDKGFPGERGEPGKTGAPGRNGVISVGRRGLPGHPGKAGEPGLPGKHGYRAQDGLPGAMGPNGLPGYRGEPGKPGPRGLQGRPGIPGSDAGYCTCPPRTVLFKKISKV